MLATIVNGKQYAIVGPFRKFEAEMIVDRLQGKADLLQADEPYRWNVAAPCHPSDLAMVRDEVHAEIYGLGA